MSSVGSLKEEIRPRDIVLADQFYDRTRRPNTFFGDGIVAHIGFARPVCPDLSGVLHGIGTGLGLRMHMGGTYLCIEGPAFSTIAESRTYRSWGCDVIGMTGATEARLFREAEICYATLNLVTDYDVWHDEEETVSVDLIFENLRLQHRERQGRSSGRPSSLSLKGPRGPAAAAMPSAAPSSPTRPSFPGRRGTGSVRSSGSTWHEGAPMSLVIVGSLAFDTIETPKERRERIVGGSGTYCALAASFFTKPRIVGVIGRDFPKDDAGLPAVAEDRPQGRRGKAGEDLPLGGPLRRGSQPADDRPDGPQRFRRLQAPPPAVVPLRGHPLPGQHRPGPPRPRPRPGEEAAARGHGHDPLLDRDQARRRRPGARAGRRLFRQRRGGQAPRRRQQPGPGREKAPEVRPVPRRRQERGARRPRLRPGLRLRRPRPALRRGRRPDRGRRQLRRRVPGPPRPGPPADAAGSSGGPPSTGASSRRSSSRTSASTGF